MVIGGGQPSSIPLEASLGPSELRLWLTTINHHQWWNVEQLF